VLVGIRNIVYSIWLGCMVGSIPFVFGALIIKAKKEFTDCFFEPERSIKMAEEVAGRMQNDVIGKLDDVDLETAEAVIQDEEEEGEERIDKRFIMKDIEAKWLYIGIMTGIFLTCFVIIGSRLTASLYYAGKEEVDYEYEIFEYPNVHYILRKCPQHYDHITYKYVHVSNQNYDY